MCTDSLNFHVFEEIGCEEHDGDVRFLTRIRNRAVSCMRNEKYALYNPYLFSELPKFL